MCFLAVFAAFAASAASEHDIEMSLSPASGEVRIEDRIRVTASQHYRFQLAPWLTIDSVSIDGASLQVKRLGQYYSIVLPTSGPHEIVFSVSGIMPLRDSQGPSDGVSTAADGSYLPSYAAWLPHDPAEPLTFRLRVTVPSPHRAVVTGKFVSEAEDSEYYRASFEQLQSGEAPSLFAGPYRVRERVSDGLRLRTYFHEEIEVHADTYLESASQYIQRYQREIGDYPYADFHIVSAPLPVGLGFPGLTYIDRRIVPLPFMRTRSLAHEVAHNWWGNAVAVDYASGNWAEGLTTYMADYGLERDKGEAAARNMRVKWLRDYAALPEARDRAVRDFKSKQHQAAQVIGYNKVAFIFHMLQQEIGEQAFAEGLRLFWREHRFGTASWRQLQAEFEKASARELDWFFRQWLDRPGAPRLTLGSHRVETVDGGYRTSIEILQPVIGYRFGLDVSLATGAGEETRRLLVEDRLTRLEWITPERPRSIHFDPQNDLFRRLQVAETPPILRDITLNPASLTVISSSLPGFSETARLLSARLQDGEPQFLLLGQSRAPGQPLLLVADFDQLAAQLERLGLHKPDDLPDVEYDAAAWTARLADDTPVLVVTAASTEALQALLRPLPHYGGQSYVLFDRGRAQSRGLWPLARGSLYRELGSAD